MRLKFILAGAILTSAFAATEARADSLCHLSVSPSSYILFGEAFSFGVDISPPPPPPSWMPSSGPPVPPPIFHVVFYGTKDGSVDIGPAGETYPGTFGFGHSDLTGFWNPGGAVGGTYLRYAVIYNEYTISGAPYCTTDTIAVVLAASPEG